VDIVGFLNKITGNNLLEWKVIAATVVFLLSGVQVMLAARLWPVATFPPVSQSTASAMHRWIGRVTLVLAIIVAISCLAGPAGPVTPLRVLMHSVFGTLVLVVIGAKFTILRVLKKGGDLLPYVGTALFLTFGGIWFTTVLDYVSR
jgi:hypothetical protein